MARGRRAVARLIHRLERPAVIPTLREQDLAFVSPMPPAPTGIATYSRAVLEGLRAIGYRRKLDVMWPVRPRDEIAVRSYGLAVYHIGNNVQFHGEIYRFAVARPGLVVLHDLGLDDLVKGLLAEGDPMGIRAWREAARRAPRLSLPEARIHEPLSLPWCAHIVRHAKGVIVHSEFAKRYLQDFGCATPVFVVPHPPAERAQDLEVARSRAGSMRARAGVRTGEVLVVAPGDLNRAKQLDALLGAVATLASVRVALVGRTIPDFDAPAAVRDAGVGDRAVVAADVPDHEFLAWIAAADVVVDLRYPHRGEVSGSLARALQAGKPTVVSATGTYLDLPADAVATVPPGPVDPEALAAVLRELAVDPARRAALSERARALAAERYTLEATARGYERAIEQTLALALDPTRLALPRWARALNDIGLREEHVREGFGVSYVRGLQELAAELPRTETAKTAERRR
ncbi:MAG: glycosyltransferase family 4 protein [Actinomycetota bacterium]